MKSVLEVLRQARSRIIDGEEFNFGSWTSCTCGHIFAASGDKDWLSEIVPDTRLALEAQRAMIFGVVKSTVYSEVIMEVAKALGWDGSRLFTVPGGPVRHVYGDQQAAAYYVSDYTFYTVAHLNNMNEDAHLVEPHHATAVIKMAIRRIERAEEEARLNILAESRYAVDGVARYVVDGAEDIPTVIATSEDYDEAYAEAHDRDKELVPA